MADVSKIKLPDNTEVNIKDSRIPGIDSTPTSGSTNPVTSGGVYSALNSKQDELIFDSTPTPQSENPVTSTGIFNYVNPLFDLVNPPIEYIPTSLTIRPYTILDTNKYGASDQYKHVLIPIGSGYKVTVESNSSTRAQIAWFTSDAYPTGGGTPPFVSGTGKIRTTSAGSTESFIAPNGANYLYVYLGQSSEYSYAPTLVTVTGNTNIQVDSVPTENSDRLVRSGGVYTAINNIPSLPSVTSSDNGKVMQVISGAWAADSLSGYLPLAGGTMTGPIELTPTTSSTQTSDGIDFGSLAHIGTATGGSIGIYSTNAIYLRPGNGSISSSYGIDIGTGTCTFKAPNVVIAAGTSGTPTLEFRRGTTSDNYVDWKLEDNGGSFVFVRSTGGTDTNYYLFSGTALYPIGTVADNVSALTLGTSSNQWDTVYAKDVTASGDIAATGTVTGSNIPTYHTGTSDPSSSLGSDGDIYLKLSS